MKQTFDFNKILNNAPIGQIWAAMKILNKKDPSWCHAYQPGNQIAKTVVAKTIMEMPPLKRDEEMENAFDGYVSAFARDMVLGFLPAYDRDACVKKYIFRKSQKVHPYGSNFEFCYDIMSDEHDWLNKEKRYAVLKNDASKILKKNVDGINHLAYHKKCKYYEQPLRNFSIGLAEAIKHQIKEENQTQSHKIKTIPSNPFLQVTPKRKLHGIDKKGPRPREVAKIIGSL